MSKSPSPSPSTNISPTKPLAPTQSEHTTTTTSRHQIHDNSPHQTGERVIHSPPFPSSVHSSPSTRLESSAGPSRAGPSRIRPREDEPSEEQPMAKRLRRDSELVAPSDRSSPSTEGGLADTEEAERSQHSEISSAPPPPPKKKRTRTLTTPHQSAVLHALLAQSRFPTTAMREEVGRAIGLSARKVQIWFQNQRQKARRPRAQNEAQVTRPPQYGPFPSAPETEPVAGMYPRAPASSHPDIDPRSMSEQQYDDRGYNRYPPGTLYGGSPPRTSPRLLGPGVPGYSSSTRPVPPSMRERTSPEVSPVASSAHPYSSRLHSYHRSPSPHRAARPSTSYPPEPRHIYRDPSRTLPPLTFPAPGHASPTSIRSAPANISPPYPYRAPSYESVVLPRVAENPPVGNLPPPFALQPQPQWDNSAFTAVPRTGSWSRPSSERSESISPTTSRGLHPIRDDIPSDPLGTSRRGRFDPVRSSIVPLSTPKSPLRSSRSPDSRANEP